MKNLTFDFWTVWGFVGQAIFLCRFFVQWWASEKQKKSVIPDSFWYLSIIGTLILLVYAYKRNDVVFMIGFSLTLLVYSRNIYLSHKYGSRIIS
jgi:lipid-A-disaccharide synthase-like uncharacterized protein